MRCKVCSKPMREVRRSKVPLWVPVVLVLGGAAAVVALAGKLPLPVAAASAAVAGVAGVWVARLSTLRRVCTSCGSGEALDAAGEAMLEAREKAADRELWGREERERFEAERRPQIEA